MSKTDFETFHSSSCRKHVPPGFFRPRFYYPISNLTSFLTPFFRSLLSLIVRSPSTFSIFLPTRFFPSCFDWDLPKRTAVLPRVKNGRQTIRKKFYVSFKSYQRIRLSILFSVFWRISRLCKHAKIQVFLTETKRGISRVWRGIREWISNVDLLFIGRTTGTTTMLDRRRLFYQIQTIPFSISLIFIYVYWVFLNFSNNLEEFRRNLLALIDWISSRDSNFHASFKLIVSVHTLSPNRHIENMPREERKNYTIDKVFVVRKTPWTTHERAQFHFASTSTSNNDQRTGRREEKGEKEK